MQTDIGWDEFLKGKLAKDWRTHQSEYEAVENRKQKHRNIKGRLEHRIVSNPYARDKEKTQNQKKKKKSKDAF